MGLYDRGYMQDDWGRKRKNGYMMVTYIIIINVVLFFTNALVTPPEIKYVEEYDAMVHDSGLLTETLTLHPHHITNPLYWYEFLTYGFVHSSQGISHLLFNMLGLFFFGYEVEYRLGGKEFLRFYLTTIIFGGLCYSLVNFREPMDIGCHGASGGVVGVIITFVLMYPYRTVFLFFFPVPAWILGLILVGSDLFGIVSERQGIAFVVHLAGAGFAYLYYQNRWNLGKTFAKLTKPFNFWSKNSSKTKNKKGAGFGAFESSKKKAEDEEEFNKRLDAILSKYSRFGEGALSKEEKELLNQASTKFKDKYKKE